MKLQRAERISEVGSDIFSMNSKGEQQQQEKDGQMASIVMGSV